MIPQRECSAGVHFIHCQRTVERFQRQHCRACRCHAHSARWRFLYCLCSGTLCHIAVQRWISTLRLQSLLYSAGGPSITNLSPQSFCFAAPSKPIALTGSNFFSLAGAVSYSRLSDMHSGVRLRCRVVQTL